MWWVQGLRGHPFDISDFIEHWAHGKRWEPICYAETLYTGIYTRFDNGRPTRSDVSLQG
jgi:hypothetical protein